MGKKNDQYSGESIWPEPKSMSINFGEDSKQAAPNKEQSGPVTVLGMTFDNDEARRAYFREELRKRLPELRKIEGFPIGEDDNIISLSDPPYYTACPNPWLNDFIAEWELEKKKLEAEGKRKSKYEVRVPYASDVSEGKANSIYMAHAYHTKVPHPAIMRYILHYTQPGDIIFDGFAGTGMTGVAANMCENRALVANLNEKRFVAGHRYSICSDLSPIATLIAANYVLPFKLESFIEKASNILDQVDNELGWMYETIYEGTKTKVNYTIWSDVYSCPSCAREIVLWEESVDLNNAIIKDSFPCPHCGFECSKKNLLRAKETCFDSVTKTTVSVSKKVPVINNISLSRNRDVPFNDKDSALLSKIDSLCVDNYLGEIPDGDESCRNYLLGFYHIHQLFTKRNYVYLTRIYEKVKGDVFLTAWFTSVIQNASKMYKFRLDRKGGIVSGTLFTPSFNIEQNPYRLLKAKLRDFRNAFYHRNGNSVVSLLSATKLSFLDENVIDYIFVDPPFGSNIMYSELSSIWEGWLHLYTNNKTEAIINKHQQKAILDYQVLMNQSLKEFYRVLKPGKWLTMEFSNTSAAVWNSIQNALQGVGFIIANVSALDKQQGSFKAVTTTTAVKQDLVISCYKPSAALLEKFDVSAGSVENAWDFIEEHLSHLAVHIEKGNQTTTVVERSPKILYDRLITYYVQHGYPVPMDAHQFQDGLRERYLERDGMFFTAAQAAEYEQKRKNTTGFAPMGIIVSDEANGIQWLRNFLRNSPKTYQQIQPDWMQAINGLRKNDILPELREILEENFIEETDGRWRLPNIQDDVDMNSLRTKALLREFRRYVEVAMMPRGKIKEARVEALRAGFKQCYIDKDFETIVMVSNKIPQNLLQEDEVLLQFYDIALNKV